MTGETDLTVLLRTIKPILYEDEYVFCNIESQTKDWIELNPLCFFREQEGLTLILVRKQADAARLPYSCVFRMITLSVHSSLEAVGFIAAIATKLAESGISVNPVSGYYHDHLFVPVSRVDEVMKLLREFSS